MQQELAQRITKLEEAWALAKEQIHILEQDYANLSQQADDLIKSSRLVAEILGGLNVLST